METIDFREEDALNHEIMARISRQEVTLRCALCKGPIRIDRLGGAATGPLVMISCVKDQKHCAVRFLQHGNQPTSK